jgi:glycosyltransferase involved in cell wall biosynthesis
MRQSPTDIQYVEDEFKPKNTRYCVAVVVLNEGERLKRQLKEMQSYAGVADIIVSDGQSSDGSTSPELLKSCDVRVLLTTAQMGLATATRVAIDYALKQGYDGVITLDGNGKDGVEAIPQFITALEEGFDLVQGSRFMPGGFHQNTPLERYVGVRYVVAPLIAVGGFWYTDPTNAFRALSRRFLIDERLQPLRPIFVRFNLHHYLLLQAARLRFRIKEIPVRRVYPSDGSIPTKITSLRTKLLFVRELLLAVMKRYDV